ncbi:MAG: Ig-like domain-containing protein, partial [Clostridiales bacterium]|nr:Ig-like domain-containing protein [Clostridiales bacterium]
AAGTVTVQYKGGYKTFKNLVVSSDTAESYGYTNDTTQGVSLLDALFTVHKQIYGDAFKAAGEPDDKGNWSNDYISIGPRGSGRIVAFKMFGETTYDTSTDTYLGDFTVNGIIPNAGWYPCGAAIQFSYINAITIGSGDVVQFFTGLDSVNKYVWLEYKGNVASWKNSVTAAKNTNVSLTAKQVEFGTGLGRSATISELQGQGEAAKNLKLGFVNLDTGEITPIENAVTLNDGTITLQFSKQNSDAEQVYYITAYSDDNKTIKNLTKVIIVDEIEDNSKIVTNVTVKPTVLSSAAGRLVQYGPVWYATCTAVNDTITFKAYDQNGKELTSHLTWTSSSNSNFPIDSNGTMTAKLSNLGTAGKSGSATATATYTYTNADGASVSVQGKSSITFMSKMDLSNKTCNISNSNISNASGKLSPAAEGYNTAGLVSYSVDDPDGAINYTISSSSLSYTAVRPGIVTVTCSEIGNETNNTVTATITVNNLFVKTPDGTTQNATAYIGRSLQLSTSAANNATVTWTSKNEAVAEVDSTGKVTPVAPGTADITAKDSAGNEGTITVLVKAPDDFSLDYLYLSVPNNTYYLGSALAGSALQCPSQYYKGALLSTNISGSTVNSGLLLSGGSSFTKTYYVNNSVTMVLAPMYDSDKVRAEVWRNGMKFADCTNGGFISIPTTTATTVITVKTYDKNTSAADPYREYTFNISKLTGDASAILKAPVVTVVTDSGRTNYTNFLCNGYAEGTVLTYSPNSSAALKSGWNTGNYNNCSFVYHDATGVNLKLSAADSITGHVRYSTDDGVTWTECPSAVYTTPTFAFGGSDSITIRMQCASDGAYLVCKELYGDGWSNNNSIKTYTFTIYRLSADPANMLLQDLKFTDNCIEGTPVFNTATESNAFALVNSRANTAGLKFKFDSGKYSVKLGNDTSSLYDLTASGAEIDAGGYYNLSILMGSVNSSTGVYTPADSVRYYLYLNLTDNVTISGITAPVPLVISKPYQIDLYRKSAAANVPTSVVDYVVPNNYYTNNTAGNYGRFPEQTLASTPDYKVLGDFGGYITWYFADGIENSPNNPCGVDFVINSTSGSKREPGAVYVSVDGKSWYELAGSDHYESSTIWNYNKTYTPGNSAYPSAAFYPLHNFTGEETSLTVKGTLLGTNAAWGRVGEGCGYSGSDYFNPYGENYYMGGTSYDLAWAVDAQGSPVPLGTVHDVKVKSAVNTAFGNSDHLTCCRVKNVFTATPRDTAVCKTAAPASIAVGNTTIYPEDGVYTYYAAVDSFETVKTSVASSAANVYINNFRGSTFTYQAGKFDSNKGIIRIVVQNGICEPLIYYIHVVTANVVTKMIEALPATITINDESAVTAAANAYEALSETQKAEISEANKAKLENARNAYSAASITRVKNLIAAIGTVSLNSGDAIASARRAYNNLTSEQKKGVDTYSMLTAAEVQYTELLIDAIGVVTKNSGEKISASRKAYDMLDSNLQNSVKNYGVLSAAEIAYVKALVDTIDLTNISADTAAQVTAATNAYKALNADQKAKIKEDGYDVKLTEVQNTYAVSVVISLIDALPSANSGKSVLLTAAENIEKTYEAFDNLTLEQKAMVPQNKTNKLSAVYSAYRIVNIESLISLIKNPVTLQDKNAAAAAEAEYKKLTSAEKAAVDSDTNYALSKATVTIAQLEDYQRKAASLLKNYPDKSKYTGENADALTKALTAGMDAINAAYDKTSIDTALIAAKASIDAVPTNEEIIKEADAAAAAIAVEKIKAIESCQYKDLKSIVAEARKAYDSLTITQKALINADTLKILTSAESLLSGNSGGSGSSSGGIPASPALPSAPPASTSGDIETVAATITGSANSATGITAAAVTADMAEKLANEAKAAELKGKKTVVTIKVVAPSA